MQKNVQKMPLPSLDDLFTTQQERDEKGLENIVNIKISDIDDFPNHPFKVIVNSELKEMAESIKEKGVLSPTIVRKKENGRYEMISGHRRKKASELVNKETIPCIVRDLSDDEAAIIMVDSNQQREHVLPSEKAFAYKIKLEAIKHQGKETSRQVGEKLLSAEEVGKKQGDSARNVQRYVRLTELISPLLKLVDDKIIAISPAVEISYLKKEEQKWLLDIIETYIATPSLSQSQELKELSKEGKLSKDKIEELLSKEKPNQIEKLKVDMQTLRRKIPRNITQDQYTEYIYKAIDFYNKYREKQKSINIR